MIVAVRQTQWHKHTHKHTNTADYITSFHYVGGTYTGVARECGRCGPHMQAALARAYPEIWIG